MLPDARLSASRGKVFEQTLAARRELMDARRARRPDDRAGARELGAAQRVAELSVRLREHTQEARRRTALDASERGSEEAWRRDLWGPSAAELELLRAQAHMAGQRRQAAHRDDVSQSRNRIGPAPRTMR